MSNSLKILLLACVLFQLQISYAEEVVERNCLENNLYPDDELSELDNSTFNLFANELERYTGLGQETFSVSLNCEQTSCTVNPNGTAIWDARMHFYMNNMMSNNNDSSITLDGCLCYSTDTAEFQNCMDEVRGIMLEQLDTVLVEKFKEIVESNCTGLFQENCT